MDGFESKTSTHHESGFSLPKGKLQTMLETSSRENVDHQDADDMLDDEVGENPEQQPNPKRRLKKLEKKNPTGFEQLKHYFSSLPINRIDLTTEDGIQQFGDRHLQPLWYSPQQDMSSEGSYIEDTDGNRKPITGSDDNIGMTKNGELVEYSHMGENNSSRNDMQFLGRGVYVGKVKDDLSVWQK